ncbi:MAG: S8 family serine peptidase, partial [bacterium]|nr:S8 family serine peptidase [bacterium]
MLRHLSIIAFILGSLTQTVVSSEKSSYIVVLEESSRLTNDTINSYAKRLKSDLQIKINNLKLNASLRSIIKDEDKLWISQSIRLDLTRTQVDEIAKNPQVQAIVEDNVIYLQEPIIEKNIDLNRQKVTYGLESLEVTKVWEKYKFLGQGITVGIIDTGWAQHPDLVGKVIRSKDFVSEFKENEPNDDRGHGTHCMGTIGGGNESGKAIGVAPKVKFVVAKIFDYEGKAYRSGILKAMQWMTNPDGDLATNDFPRVISNSWGKKYEGYENEIDYIRASEVWRQFEIAPVFAAGNSGPSSNTIASPAALKTNLAVAAIDEKDKIGTFSSRGIVRWKDGVIITKPNISAPGVKVYSSTRNGGYASWSGTSMACPHVAGVIALMLQANPSLTVTEIFSILEQSAYELGEPGWDKAYGYGKISALRAVEIALNLSYLSLNIETQSSIVRMTDINTGQVYRFESGKTNTLYLKNGLYSFTLQSFGSVDQKLEVELLRGKTVSVVTKLEKAPTATWVLNVVSEKNKPM